ncbi:hypothetical protein DesfrDRAFT_0601 [Solidesulfovibrio fructosivorans JJ]]|uniref:Uncharacterized protein n=1 Tax=Solidesulfovibrio fructosivorans JJ] TaxID=596151 RepID=E1JSL2_SOLFR|nr:hypothetical protein DesfrDRAFT_0601 [Solidesulfovibrio fructosivorans JJ]]
MEPGAGTFFCKKRSPPPDPHPPKKLLKNMTQRSIFCHFMRRFAAGAVVAAIASGVEGLCPSCRRADCGDKYPGSRTPAMVPPGKV